MRISDWSSDVCSSDLPPSRPLSRLDVRPALPFRRGAAVRPGPRRGGGGARLPLHLGAGVRGAGAGGDPVPPLQPPPAAGARAGAGAGRGDAVHSLGASPRRAARQIGSASCRERVCQYVYISLVAVPFTKKNIITI